MKRKSTTTITDAVIKQAMHAFLERGGQVKKIGQGKAEGATTHGSVCAGNFSASSTMRAASQARGFKDWKDKQKQKKIKKRKYRKLKVEQQATARQINYLREIVGPKADLSGLTKRSASNMIQQALRETSEFNRRQKKALGL